MELSVLAFDRNRVVGMQLILFETAVVAQRPDDGELLIALIDGRAKGLSNECVALLTCPVETARSLCKALGSALKEADA